MCLIRPSVDFRHLAGGRSSPDPLHVLLSKMAGTNQERSEHHATRLAPELSGCVTSISPNLTPVRKKAVV